jgi:arylsulfatase
VATRIPYLYNLRTDPFERADVTSNTYWAWYIDRVFLLMPAQSVVAEFLGTFIDFPPRMEAASFTIDQVQEKLEAAISAGR